ncbi:MAG TPA: winged helix DNA-binding domain-containing protein [Jiangellaceae bacterium]|nr:winged helix DNA-binding domain-containing protein [Jiangellaceae bacterium]
MSGDLLSNRALNRATLARQLLLARSTTAPLEAVEHLVGLQAQNPLDPYLALWSRLDAFDPHTLGHLVEDRSLVRTVVMRSTIHLVTADDALLLRPTTQPAMTMEIARHPEYAPQLAGVDMEPVLAYAHPLLTETPMSGRKLREALAERFPDLPAAAIAYACRCYLPLVQIPPRGVWGKTLQVTSTPLDSWLGRPLRTDATIDEVALRYLAAFGPAIVGDFATWSRLTGFREVVDRLRPQLRTFTDEKGRQLVDLPDAPRPDPDTPAPVRFLPEYDNVLLSHADRSRFGEGVQMFAPALGDFKGSVLVDGMVHGIWRFEVDRNKGTTTVAIRHLPLPKASVRAVETEGHHVARFWHAEKDIHDVRMTPVT